MHSISRRHLAASIIAFIAMSSGGIQVCLSMAGHKTSLVGLAVWSLIYFAISIGLIKRKGFAYFSALVLSVLQMLPLLFSWTIPLKKLFGQLPSWYAISLYMSFVAGIALLLVLLIGGKKDFISKPFEKQRVD